MAQPIKYNTGAKTANCCIRKGNYDIGVVTNYEYGPTSGSGFYAGYTIPSGGFVSYQNKASQGPSIYSIPTIDDIVNFGINLDIGVGDGSTPAEVIEQCGVNTDIAFVNIDYPEIPSLQDNILTLDAGYTASYPWQGVDWYGIDGSSSDGTLNANCIFELGTSGENYSNSSIYMKAAESAFVTVPAFAGTLGGFTINVWMNYTGTSYSQLINVVGQQYSTSGTGGAENDCNFLIRGDNSTGFEGLLRYNGANTVVNFGGGPWNVWKMLTFTFNGTTLRAYVDGSTTNSTSPGGTVTVASNGLQTVIGGTLNAQAGGSPVDYFDGNIGVVNIYQSALSAGEITTLYNSYSGRY
jgi:hypothetical protein